MGAVLALTIGAVAMAQGQGVGEFCTENGNFGVSHDACVNCSNGGADFAVCICKISEVETGVPYLGYPNLGQCVASFH